MAINLFDFSNPQWGQKKLNFWPGVSQAGVTNFQDYKKTIPVQQTIQKPTTSTSGGFSVVPKANTWELDKAKIERFIQRWKELGKSRDEIKTAYDKALQQWLFNVGWQTQPKSINELSLIDELKQRWENLWTQISKRAENIESSFTRWRSDIAPVSATQNLWASIWVLWQIVGTAGDILWEWIAFATPDVVKNALTEWWKAVWEKTPDVIKETAINSIKAGWEVYRDFKQKNPFLADTLEGSLNVASILPSWKWGQLALKWAEKTWEVLSKWWQVALKWAEKVWEWVTATTEYWTKLLTWLNRETQQAIKTNPKLFQAIKKWEITPEQIVWDLKTNIWKRLDALSETWKGYQELKKSNIQFPKTEIQAIYDARLSQEWLSKSLIELPLEDRNAIKQAQFYLSELPTNQLTTKEAIELKAKLRSLVSYDKWVSPEWERVVKGIIKDLDNNLKSKIPWYKELDATYWPEREFLNKVQKDLFNKDWTLKDNAISTIRTLTWKWKENKLDRLERIMPWIWEKVKGIKAYEDLQNAIEWKTWSYARGALLWWGWFIAWWPIWWIITFAITHPSIASKALEIYWLSKQKIWVLLNKLKTKTPLNNLEKTQISEAIKTPSNKIFNNLMKNDWISTTSNLDNISSNLQQSPKKIKPSVLSPREKELLKSNKPTNVPNKPLQETSKTWRKLLKKVLPSNFKEKAQDFIEWVADKVGARTKLMWEQGIWAEKTALLKGSDDLINRKKQLDKFALDFIEWKISKDDYDKIVLEYSDVVKNNKLQYDNSKKIINQEKKETIKYAPNNSSELWENIYYHWTNSDFNEFKLTNWENAWETYWKWIYLTNKKDWALIYSKWKDRKLLEVKVDWKIKEIFDTWNENEMKKIINNIKSNWYSWVKIKSVYLEKKWIRWEDVVLIFDPKNTNILNKRFETIEQAQKSKPLKKSN